MNTCCRVLAALLLILSSATADEPKISHVDGKQAVRLVAEKKVLVIDVRSPQEYGLAHIEGAKNIDFNGKDFETRLKELDKKQPVLVHCASGGRSTKSLSTFQKLGFEKVIHLDGGFNAYDEAREAAAR
jgi:rhodanese-related sulfurtransferase